MNIYNIIKKIIINIYIQNKLIRIKNIYNIIK